MSTHSSTLGNYKCYGNHTEIGLDCEHRDILLGRVQHGWNQERVITAIMSTLKDQHNLDGFWEHGHAIEITGDEIRFVRLDDRGKLYGSTTIVDLTNPAASTLQTQARRVLSLADCHIGGHKHNCEIDASGTRRDFYAGRDGIKHYDPSRGSSSPDGASSSSSHVHPRAHSDSSSTQSSLFAPRIATPPHTSSLATSSPIGMSAAGKTLTSIASPTGAPADPVSLVSSMPSSSFSLGGASSSRSDLSGLRSDLGESRARVITLETETGALRGQVTDAQSAAAAARKETDAQRTRAIHAENALREVTGVNTQKQKELDDATTRNRTLESALTEKEAVLQKQIDDLRSQSAQAWVDRAAALANLARANTAIEGYTTTIGTLESEIDKLKAAKPASDQELVELRKSEATWKLALGFEEELGKAQEVRLSQLEPRLHQLYSDLTAASQRRDKAQAHARTLTERLAKSEAENERLNAQLPAATERASKFHEEAQSLRLLITQAREELRAAQQRLEEANIVIQRSTSDARLMQDQQDEIDRLQGAKIISDEELTGLREAREVAAPLIHKLRDANEALKQQLAAVIDRAEKSRRVAEGSMEVMQARRDQTGAQELAHARSAIASHVKANTAMSSEITSMQGALRGAEEAYTKRRAKLQAANEALSQQLAEKTREFELQRSALAKLTVELEQARARP